MFISLLIFLLFQATVPATDKRTEYQRYNNKTPYVFANINLLQNEIDILRRRVQLQEELNFSIVKKIKWLKKQQQRESIKDADSDSGSTEASEAVVPEEPKRTTTTYDRVTDETLITTNKALSEENEKLKTEVKELKNSLLLTTNKVYAKEVANKTDENVRLYLVGKNSIYEQTVSRVDIRSLKTFLLFLNEPERIVNQDALKAWRTLFPTQESLDAVKERLKQVMHDHPKLIPSIIALKEQWPMFSRRMKMPEQIHLDDLIRYFQQTNEDERIVSALKECRVFYYKTKFVKTHWRAETTATTTSNAPSQS
jgi:hypothetical protein